MIINKLNNVIENIEKYYKINYDIINNYEIQNRNYHILQNINEFQNFDAYIIKDINKIINNNDFFTKFNMIMEIYQKMNNKDNNINNFYNDNNILKISNNNWLKLDSKIKDLEEKKLNNNENTIMFKKNPMNLKFKLNITNTNDSCGSNDIFEVYTSNKNKKEYIISKNFENFNLEIFSLLDNKKINSLQGHRNHITTIRYFLNPYNFKEYLISGDDNGTLIIQDINNNYKIKYKIDTNYNDWITSNLLIFPFNNNDNYIITTTYNTSEDIDEAATKIYSLKNSNYIKYIKNSNNNIIYYLLSWFNKKNEKYYIIELAYKKIIINNLLEDKLYCELIKEPEDYHYSGFIFNQNDKDYLCSSSENGYINIWDLYDKNIFKVINANKCCLFHIIQWNNKYIIVADRGNNTIKIIDLQKEEVVSDIKGHKNGVICIKKINHPKYGESLLSACNDKTIKLWII